MSDFDPIDHIVRMRNLQKVWTLYAPITAGIVAIIVLLICYQQPGVVGEYSVIIGGFAGVVVYVAILGIMAMKVSSWERQAKEYYDAARTKGDA